MNEPLKLNMKYVLTAQISPFLKKSTNYCIEPLVSITQLSRRTIGRYSGVGRYNFIPTPVKTTYSRGRYNFISTDALLVQRLIPTLMVSAMRGCGIVLDWTKKNDSISNRKICVHPRVPVGTIVTIFAFNLGHSSACR